MKKPYSSIAKYFIFFCIVGVLFCIVWNAYAINVTASQSWPEIIRISLLLYVIIFIVLLLVTLFWMYIYAKINPKRAKKYNNKYIIWILALLTFTWYAIHYTFFPRYSYWWDAKPVIYLYPEQKSDIFVGLDYKWELIADYPAFDESIGGWNVTADTDSTLIDKRDGKEYSYIFWEWMPEEEVDWDLSTGFVVEGNNVRDFLQDILPKMWLTPKEYNEFIVYWYPLLQDNPYNLIHFAGEQYTQRAELTTTPSYDSLLRVFMVAKALDRPIDIKAQEFSPFEREWFTVVEWGGTILK